jgi:hypothetical protein
MILLGISYAFWNCAKSPRALGKLLGDYNRLKAIYLACRTDVERDSQTVDPLVGYPKDIMIIFKASVTALERTRNMVLVPTIGLLIGSYFLGSIFLLVNIGIFFVMAFPGLSGSSVKNLLSDVYAIMLRVHKWRRVNDAACEDFCVREQPRILQAIYRVLQDDGHGVDSEEEKTIRPNPPIGSQAHTMSAPKVDGITGRGANKKPSKPFDAIGLANALVNECILTTNDDLYYKEWTEEWTEKLSRSNAEIIKKRFEEVMLIYKCASVMLVLQTETRRDSRWNDVALEIKKKLARSQSVECQVKRAARSLSELISVRGGELWARSWCKEFGVDEYNPIRLGLISCYWTSTMLAISEGVREIGNQ